ncbi:MAG: hypothetical protein IIZ78_22650 [Clostridiales bacterium]|nr:hypothetical protein [Clostridiales bacterium]
MTKEEAIELLEDLDGAIEDNHGRDYDEAFRMAIESLSAEPSKSTDQNVADVPSGDLISRQWLLDLYDIDTTNFKETAKVPLEVVIQNIKDAPSVSVEPKPIANDCDLISRADAIEAVDGLKERPQKYYTQYNNALSDAVLELTALPSADRPSNVLQKKNPTTIEDYMTGKSRSADRPQVNSNSAEEQIAETCDRPKGEWLDVEHEPFCECSVCGAYIEDLDDDFAFCPRCGADMRPEK